ncbi:GspD family T2SS secretin variant LspD [Legionella maceachernii]|uniref:Type II protein secretion LspD n=1 Tax=Legionella maceachernii TaxID=466 RepID=A0A0W0WC33_9GAMM|nr:GspD family T2SS secretin variant LspD [Legionella maceachernii]KTD29790.1 type II protein secretion LspD [Legionella maceachernii]SJZ79537.1 general secretion pathway protein D [Legionella maceachernii]SUP02897.1 Pullulanase secretion envelope pulD [Legionella maceachernii]
MRKFAFFLLTFLFIANTYATDVTLKTVTVSGKPAYMLYVGTFSQENNALQLKVKLSSSIKEPITIDHPANQNNYFVSIGPFNNYKAAIDLQKKLVTEASNKSAAQKPKVEPAASPSIQIPAQTQPQIQTQPQTPKEEATNNVAKEKTIEKENKLWNLKAADIRAVISEVSRVTGKNFVIDPRVQGKISITSSTPMSDKELYQVFLSMLQVSGYAAVPSGDVIKIIPNIDAKTISPVPLQTGNPPQGDEMMVAVVPVHYVPSEQLVPVLRPLMPQWSSVSAYGPSNMLILSGRASNIKQIVRIVKQVDAPSVNGLDMVHLKHALAMDVANTLKDLMKAQSGVGANHIQTMIAVDDRSNAIILSGSRTERLKLRLLINRLDRANLNGYESNTQVVYLNYLRAEDLVPILAGIAQANFSGNVGTTIGTITRPELDSTNPASSLVSSGSGGNYNNTSPSSSSQTAATSANASAAAPNTSGASTQNEGSTKPTVQIIAEPNTNSIIINAPASVIRILRSVINQLDIRPAQLLIEALVAEVNENDVKSLGIEWGSNQQTGKASDFRPGFAIVNGKTSIDDFQAEIFALAQQRKANILSTPSVVVLDNRQAKILIGKQVSVASTTYPNNAGGTTTASPYVTFDRVNVALHLYVRPQITRGRGIQLQIDQGNDTLDPASSPNSTTPTFDISSIVTSVHIESGDIVVLGGLIQNSLGNDNNKIPILGDIPGMGRVFQHNINNHEKRVLMVFIRPIILRNERDAVEITNGKYNDIRQYELKWLREQAYNAENKEMILPPLSQAKLPKPFSHHAKPKPPIPMTK